MTERPDLLRSRLLRDISALVLIVVGGAAVLYAAAVTDWRLLLGVCGAYAITAGALLGRGEE